MKRTRVFTCPIHDGDELDPCQHVLLALEIKPIARARVLAGNVVMVVASIAKPIMPHALRKALSGGSGFVDTLLRNDKS